MKAHVTFEMEAVELPGFFARLGLTGHTIEGVTDASQMETETPARARRTRSPETANAAPQEAAPAADVPRRRRGAASESPAMEAAPAETATASEAGSRRRRSSAPAADAAPAGISDLDLTKAASEAAEALTKLGDDGQQIVLDVLKEDFSCESVNAIPADKRKAFMDAIQEQVDLAKADAAKAA